jgi:hypothetical protein
VRPAPFSLQIFITHPACTVTCPRKLIRDRFLINKFNFFGNPPVWGQKPPQNHIR